MRRSVSQLAILIGSGLLAGAGPALAQSMPGEFYGGFSLGGSRTNSSTDDGITTFDGDARLTTLSLIGGYRVANGNYFYGAELDAGVPLGGELVSGGCASGPSLEYCAYDWDARARGIFGYRTGDVDVFGSLGFAAAKLGYRDLFGDSEYKVQTGWTAGIGVDYAVSGNMKIRAEIMHDDFGDTTFEDGYNGSWEQNTVRVGALFSF